MAEYKHLKGAITISRPQGDVADYVEITLHDESSGTSFVSVRVALVNFTEALFGLSRMECEFDLRPANVGKRHEHKEEVVDHEYGWVQYDKREEAARDILKRYEVDGWKGRADDLFNHHRIIARHRAATA